MFYYQVPYLHVIKRRVSAVNHTCQFTCQIAASITLTDLHLKQLQLENV